MSATILEAERRLPFAPQELARLVGDVRAYPHFIPWIKSLRVTGEKALEDGWEGLAHAVVGWRAINERFSTHVRCEPEAGRVDVTLQRGPFKQLENRWTFAPAPEGGTIVKFWIAYEFANPVLNTLAKVNRAHAIHRIMGAFEAEARRRFTKA